MKFRFRKKVTHQDKIETIRREFRSFILEQKSLMEYVRMVYDDYKDVKLFPLSQFKLRNPCTKCIVLSRCGEQCDDKTKNLRLKSYIKGKKKFFLKMIPGVVGLTLLVFGITVIILSLRYV